MLEIRNLMFYFVCIHYYSFLHSALNYPNLHVWKKLVWTHFLLIFVFFIFRFIHRLFGTDSCLGKNSFNPLNFLVLDLKNFVKIVILLKFSLIFIVYLRIPMISILFDIPLQNIPYCRKGLIARIFLLQAFLFKVFHCQSCSVLLTWQ